MQSHLKDYYRILEISPVAGQTEIKKSYRRLALKYHPDKNPENNFASAMFSEVQEAYTTLSEPDRRRKYDEQRWLSGMTSRSSGQQLITAEWILQECRKLSIHMSSIDTYRMDHNALYEYVLILLSDPHIAVLQNEPSEIRHHITRLIISSSRSIRHPYMEMIAGKVQPLCSDNKALMDTLAAQVLQSKNQAGQNKYAPWAVVLITLALCVFMYLWHRYITQ